ncbi:MAG: hypothetical protein K2N78_07065, partial [Oscillospiraceae bacterium]|nr:hypothetical protein [Oscillospiraceae bacterium]
TNTDSGTGGTAYADTGRNARACVMCFLICFYQQIPCFVMQHLSHLDAIYHICCFIAISEICSRPNEAIHPKAVGESRKRANSVELHEASGHDCMGAKARKPDMRKKRADRSHRESQWCL